MDRASFERFYERRAPALRSYLRYSCRNRALADDLLQETWLRLLCADLPELEEPELKSYLYKTARSVMIDHFRKTAREQRFVDDDRFDAALESGAGAAQPDFALPDDVRRVLAELPERDRQLLWLAHVEGFSHREIAPLIGVQENSVRVLLLRARERMAALLEDQGMGPEDTG